MSVSENETMAELLLARSDDDHPALRSGDQQWSWREVVAESAVRAALLDELRTGGPFHVGVLLDNVAEYVMVLGGAALAGATVVGINPTRRGEELAGDIRHTDCQLVLTDRSHARLLEGLDLGIADGRVLLVDGPDYPAMLKSHAGAGLPLELPGPECLYVLMFTSGSTGAPKAVRMTQGRAARTAARSGINNEDVLYCAMPLFHGNALNANLFPAMRAGATVVLRRRFSASGFLPDVRQYGCTFFNYIGRALAYILATPETPNDRDHRLRYGLGSEASPRDLAEFRRRFGVSCIEGYGSSENAIVMMPVPGMPRGALGRPEPGLDVAIVDPGTGRECPPARLDAEGRLINASEAIGEIVGRNSVSRFEGYYNNTDAGAERTRNGWYWSGDLGYRDTDGYFYFAGRTADWLRVDGENFAATPVERILGRFPGVAGVAVYAVPDSRTADQVMAAVEMQGGIPFDPEAFAVWLAEQVDLGTKWAPRYVRVVASLPVTATNKVNKQPLRAERWCTTDPVWWRPVGAGPYRLMSAEDIEALHAEFELNGRSSFLGR